MNRENLDVKTAALTIEELRAVLRREHRKATRKGLAHTAWLLRLHLDNPTFPVSIFAILATLEALKKDGVVI